MRHWTNTQLLTALGTLFETFLVKHHKKQFHSKAPNLQEATNSYTIFLLAAILKFKKPMVWRAIPLKLKKLPLPKFKNEIRLW